MKKNDLKEKFPKNFFTKIRSVSKPANLEENEVIPIRWSKEVMKGKKKAIVRKMT